MIARVVVDTDVVSYIFKGDTRGDAYRRHLVGRLGIVCFMTVAELDRWALNHSWGDQAGQTGKVLAKVFHKILRPCAVPQVGGS